MTQETNKIELYGDYSLDYETHDNDYSNWEHHTFQSTSGEHQVTVQQKLAEGKDNTQVHIATVRHRTRNTITQAVVKIVDIYYEFGYQAALKERDVMMRLGSAFPNVATLLFPPVRASDLHKVFFVMEGCWGGDLGKTLLSHGVFPEREVLNIGLQISTALAGLHDIGLIHGDIKPANVVKVREGGLDNLEVKLIDFDGAIEFWPDFWPEVPEGGHGGSRLQRSPEQRTAGARIGPPTDVFSLAVLMFELLTNTLPFHDVPGCSYVEASLSGAYNTSAAGYVALSPGCKQLLGRMLVSDPLRRITVPELISALQQLLGSVRSPPFEVVAPPPQPTPMLQLLGSVARAPPGLKLGLDVVHSSGVATAVDVAGAAAAVAKCGVEAPPRVLVRPSGLDAACVPSLPPGLDPCIGSLPPGLPLPITCVAPPGLPTPLPVVAVSDAPRTTAAPVSRWDAVGDSPGITAMFKCFAAAPAGCPEAATPSEQANEGAATCSAAVPQTSPRSVADEKAAAAKAAYQEAFDVAAEAAFDLFFVQLSRSPKTDGGPVTSSVFAPLCPKTRASSKGPVPTMGSCGHDVCKASLAILVSEGLWRDDGDEHMPSTDPPPAADSLASVDNLESLEVYSDSGVAQQVPRGRMRRARRVRRCRKRRARVVDVVVAIGGRRSGIRTTGAVRRSAAAEWLDMSSWVPAGDHNPSLAEAVAAGGGGNVEAKRGEKHQQQQGRRGRRAWRDLALRKRGSHHDDGGQGAVDQARRSCY